MFENASVVRKVSKPAVVDMTRSVRAGLSQVRFPFTSSREVVHSDEEADSHRR